MSPGDTVEAIVSDVNRDSRRISLSLKDTLPDPWEGVLAKYKVGDSVAGKVRNLTDFGAFVEIEEGVDGLVHVSDMSWTRRIKHPSEVLKKGDDVQAIITSIDQENRRISLSIKEFQPNDWQTFKEKHQPGDIVEGAVSRLADFGVFVQIEGLVEGAGRAQAHRQRRHHTRLVALSQRRVAVGGQPTNRCAGRSRMITSRKGTRSGPASCGSTTRT